MDSTRLFKAMGNKHKEMRKHIETQNKEIQNYSKMARRKDKLTREQHKRPDRHKSATQNYLRALYNKKQLQ